MNPLGNPEEQDKSSDVEQKPHFKSSKALPQTKGWGGLQRQREKHIILTKYILVHLTVFSEIIPHQGC